MPSRRTVTARPSRMIEMVSPSARPTTFPVKRSWAAAGRLHRTNTTRARRSVTVRAANRSYCPLGRSGNTEFPSWSSLGSGSNAALGLELLLMMVASLRARWGGSGNGGRRLPVRHENRRPTVRTRPIPRRRFRQRHLNFAAAEGAARVAVVFRARPCDVNLLGLREQHAETSNEQHCRQDKSPRGALKHFEHGQPMRGSVVNCGARTGSSTWAGPTHGQAQLGRPN